jgi:hypothetical protein
MLESDGYMWDLIPGFSSRLLENKNVGIPFRGVISAIRRAAGLLERADRERAHGCSTCTFMVYGTASNRRVFASLCLFMPAIRIKYKNYEIAKD